jgi:hypothetical protein
MPLDLTASAQWANRGRVVLADLPPLAEEDFQLLLFFLGCVLNQPPGGSGTREAHTPDGLLRLVLEAPALAAPPAILQTTSGRGRLALPAYTLTIHRLGTEPAKAAGESAAAICKNDDLGGRNGCDVVIEA